MKEIMEQLKPFIGLSTSQEVACDVVERGAVRRYAQAIMYEDEIFNVPCDRNAKFGGPVAPPLFATHMFRRPFGTSDPIQANANNPDFDGIVAATSSSGLPELTPLKGFALLNGGSEIEFFKYPNHGDTVSVVSKYHDITLRETSKGPMFFVVVESSYSNQKGELLIRTRRTQIRRR